MSQLGDSQRIPTIYFKYLELNTQLGINEYIPCLSAAGTVAGKYWPFIRLPSAILGVLAPVGEASDGDLADTADPAIGDIAAGAAEFAPSGPNPVGPDPGVDTEAEAASVTAAPFVATEAPVSDMVQASPYIQ